MCIKNYEVANDSIESEKNYVYIYKKKEPTLSGMNQPEFIPTDEFQYIPPGASVPWGCRYRMDFETGFKQARWEKDRKNESKVETNTTQTQKPNKTTKTTTKDTPKNVFKEKSSLDDSKDVAKIQFEVKLEENLPVQIEILDLASNILREENLKKGLYGSIPPSTISNAFVTYDCP